MTIGYGRVSTEEQDTALQRDALSAAGCEKIFEEVVSTGKAYRPQLAAALEFARWIFKEGPLRLRDLIRPDCEFGLDALYEEASYQRSGHAYDVPSVRAACIRLALAMSSAGFAEAGAIGKWLTTAKDDPLPEVRNAEVR